jgi:hypothetical protein
MGKKKTMPVEPDEMPVQPEKPEIRQPGDPGEPQIPEEAPEHIPQEMPPGEVRQPEIKPVDGENSGINLNLFNYGKDK